MTELENSKYLVGLAAKTLKDEEEKALAALSSFIGKFDALKSCRCHFVSWEPTFAMLPEPFTRTEGRIRIMFDIALPFPALEGEVRLPHFRPIALKDVFIDAIEELTVNGALGELCETYDISQLIFAKMNYDKLVAVSKTLKKRPKNS